MLSSAQKVSIALLIASMAALWRFEASWAAALSFIASLALFGLLAALELKRQDMSEEVSEKIKALADKIQDIEMRRLGR